MKMLFVLGIILVLITAGCSNATGNVVAQDGYSPSGKLQDGARVVDVKAFQFDFDPNPIVVNQGERVRLVVTSLDVGHGIAIPEYGISQTLPPRRPTTIEFTADKSGTFPFFCNVYCGSGHGAMRGVLVVQ